METLYLVNSNKIKDFDSTHWSDIDLSRVKAEIDQQSKFVLRFKWTQDIGLELKIIKFMTDLISQA